MSNVYVKQADLMVISELTGNR